MSKILVIEDEIGVRDSLVDILNAEDFIVDSAADGAAGLDQIREFHPDLVICDIMMPVLDGYGVLEQVRQDPALATLPFVFLTAKAERHDFRSGMDLGADDYLTKPFTHDDLLKMIRTRLEVQGTQKKEAQSQLEALRSSISLSLPRELGAPIREVLNLSAKLAKQAETLEPAEIISLAKAIQRNAQQTDRLTHNVMLLNQLEHVDKEQADLATLRQQLTPSADRMIADLAQRIATEYLREDDLEIALEPLTLPMSESKLKKVCEELLDNAFKFSQVGDPVQVYGTHREGFTTLYIIDYGRGMTLEEIAQLGAFRQFAAGADNAHGAGLGFEIAQRLVEWHQGEIIIESIPGEQTIVRIALPD